MKRLASLGVVLSALMGAALWARRRGEIRFGTDSQPTRLYRAEANELRG